MARDDMVYRTGKRHAHAQQQQQQQQQQGQRLHVPSAGGDAVFVDKTSINLDVNKLLASSSTPKKRLDIELSNKTWAEASTEFDADYKRFVTSLFPNFVETPFETSAMIELENVSVNGSFDLCKFEKSFTGTDLQCESPDMPVEDFPPGTLETHEDAERRLNVHIIRWFKQHLDDGNAFENMMRDFVKLKTLRLTAVDVPFMSYELDSTRKETYKVNASRINPEDYRGMKFVICDQPTSRSAEDFWRLIWKERARAIVALQFSPLECPGADDEYWPTRPHQNIRHGEFVIVFRGSRFKSGYMSNLAPHDDRYIYRTTTLSVYNLRKVRSTISNPPSMPPPGVRISDSQLECFESHYVKHICFDRWPDITVPIPWAEANTHAGVALVLSEHVLKHELRNHQRFRGPVVLHTPTGSSRPICLVALKHSLARLFFDRIIDVPAAVMNVIRQRNIGHVSSSQFVLLNLLVMEEAIRRNMVPQTYRSKIDRLWDELINYIGRKCGFALATFYRSLVLLTH